MNVKEQLEALLAEVSAERLRLNKIEWSLEQLLHRRRIALIGASGIEHRVIEKVEDVDREIAEVLALYNNGAACGSSS